MIHATLLWKTRWWGKELYFQWILRIHFHCCERDIFQEGQFWLYPVLIPIRDGGTRVIKLIKLGYVLWNWASTLQIFCLIHYWTFHRILINSSNQLRKIGLDAVFNYRSYLGLVRNSQKYYKVPLQAPFMESSLILIINLDWSEGCCFILNWTKILDSPILHVYLFHIMCVYIAPCHFFSA